MAMSDCCRQVTWIQLLFSELGIEESGTSLCGDNQGSIFIGSNPIQEHRTKYIDIRYHYIRKCVEDGRVETFFIKGSENPADMFTKNLGHVKFLKFGSQIRLEFY